MIRRNIRVRRRALAATLLMETKVIAWTAETNLKLRSLSAFLRGYPALGEYLYICLDLKESSFLLTNHAQAC